MTYGTHLSKQTFSSQMLQNVTGKEKEVRKNLLGEIIAGNFPNLGKDTDFQAQETQRTSNKFNKNRSFSRRIIVKLSVTEQRKDSLKSI